MKLIPLVQAESLEETLLGLGLGQKAGCRGHCKLARSRRRGSRGWVWWMPSAKSGTGYCVLGSQWEEEVVAVVVVFCSPTFQCTLSFTFSNAKSTRVA